MYARVHANKCACEFHFSVCMYVCFRLGRGNLAGAAAAAAAAQKACNTHTLTHTAADRETHTYTIAWLSEEPGTGT